MTHNKRLEMDAIALPEEFSSYTVIGQEEKELRPLSNINIFVGANNTGKSRFMRLLTQQDSYNYKSKHGDYTVLNQQIRESLQSLSEEFISRGLETFGTTSLQAIQSLIEQLPSYLSSNSDAYMAFRNWFERSINLSNGDHSASGSGLRGMRSGHELPPRIRETCSCLQNALENISIQDSHSNPKRVYIPIIRGLRPLDDDRTDFYAQRTQKRLLP